MFFIGLQAFRIFRRQLVQAARTVTCCIHYYFALFTQDSNVTTTEWELSKLSLCHDANEIITIRNVFENMSFSH